MESHLKLAVVIFGVLTVQFLGNGPALSAAQASDTTPTTTTPTTAPTTTAPGATTTVPGATTTVPGATTTAPGATTTVPGATTTVPGATTTVPGATTTAPGATTTAATTTTTAPPATCTCCTNCTTMATVTEAGQRWKSCAKYATAGSTMFTVIPDNQGQCMMSGTSCSQCCPQCLSCKLSNGAWYASCVPCPSSATGKPMM